MQKEETKLKSLAPTKISTFSNSFLYLAAYNFEVEVALKGRSSTLEVLGSTQHYYSPLHSKARKPFPVTQRA